jgi:Tfp pilus assembly protein PilO
MAAMKIDLNKLKNIKLTKEQQQFLVLGIVGIAAGAYGYWTYLLKPINEDIVRKRAEVKTKSENLAEARKLKAQDDQYNQRVAFVQSGRQFFARRIPAIKDRLGTITRINKICLEQNMYLVSYRAESDAGAAAKADDLGDNYEKQVATIEVLSNYHGFGAFLSRLSAEDIVYNVDEVQLTQGDQSVKRGLVVATMKLVTYTEKATQ